MRLTKLAALTVVALYLAGCGGGNDSIEAGSSQAAAPEAEGQPPTTLLSREDVQKQPPGSARAAVMNLLYWAQWGNWPEVVAAYEPRIRSVAEDTRIMGTYQQQRGSLMTTRFSIRDQASTSRGRQFVAVEFTLGNGMKQSQSYLLVRRGGKWRISNDTFFQAAYRTYMQDVVQTAVAPGATKPAGAALRAAAAAAESLRAAVVAPERDP